MTRASMYAPARLRGPDAAGVPSRHRRRHCLLPLLLATLPLLVVCALASLSAHAAAAFYIPGTSPVTYQAGAQLPPVHSTGLFSPHSKLPYGYYSVPLHCARLDAGGAKARPHYHRETLGSVLAGEREVDTAYDLVALRNASCTVACRAPRVLRVKQLQRLQQLIDDSYRVRVSLDNMEGVVREQREAHVIEGGGGNGTQAQQRGQSQEPSGAELARRREHSYRRGYPVGYRDSVELTTTYGDAGGAGTPSKPVNAVRRYLVNHLDFEVLYHRPRGVEHAAAATGVRIVGLELTPRSIDYFHREDERDNSTAATVERAQRAGAGDACPAVSNAAPELDIDALQPGDRVLYTYAVTWRESPVRWATRWDALLRLDDERDIVGLEWLSTAESLIAVVALAALAACILLRALRRDLAAYSSLLVEDEREAREEEAGWKAVAGDVFRPPTRGFSALCVLVGAGVQLALALAAVAVLGYVGLLSPAYRGGVMSVLIGSYALAAAAGGYVSVRVYVSRAARPPRLWLGVAAASALLYPALALGVFFGVNVLAYFSGSTAAVPFLTLVYLLALWLGLSLPLAIVGGGFARRQRPIEYPCRTTNIPRHVATESSPMNKPAVTMLVGGTLPFAALFVNLFFLLGSAWLGHYFFLFSFVMLSYVCALAITALVNVIFTYAQLTREDWRWWWRSFWTGGCVALYVAAYALYYLDAELRLTDAVSVVMYLGYTVLLLSAAVLCVGGAIGFLSSWCFVRVLYSQIKAD